MSSMVKCGHSNISYKDLPPCAACGIVSEKSQRHTGDFQYLSNNCGHQVVLQVHSVLGHLSMQVLLISCTFSQYVYCYMYISVLFKE